MHVSSYTCVSFAILCCARVIAVVCEVPCVSLFHNLRLRVSYVALPGFVGSIVFTKYCCFVALINTTAVKRVRTEQGDQN